MVEERFIAHGLFHHLNQYPREGTPETGTAGLTFAFFSSPLRGHGTQLKFWLLKRINYIAIIH